MHIHLTSKKSALVVIIALVVADLRAADLIWTNLAGGNWNDLANWSPNQVPGVGDSAFITNGGTYTVSVNVNVEVGSLLFGANSGTQTLSISSGILTLDSSSTIHANAMLRLSGGTLSGSGDLTVNGALDWSTGTMEGSGKTIIANTGTLSISGGNAANHELN